MDYPMSSWYVGTPDWKFEADIFQRLERCEKEGELSYECFPGQGVLEVAFLVPIRCPLIEHVEF
jgi:hypothetical protein